jgi:hypothetical protein
VITKFVLFEFILDSGDGVVRWGWVRERDMEDAEPGLRWRLAHDMETLYIFNTKEV